MASGNKFKIVYNSNPTIHWTKPSRDCIDLYMKLCRDAGKRIATRVELDFDSNYWEDIRVRRDPHFVQAIETLGEKANTKECKFKIALVPIEFWDLVTIEKGDPVLVDNRKFIYKTGEKVEARLIDLLCQVLKTKRQENVTDDVWAKDMADIVDNEASYQVIYL